MSVAQLIGKLNNGEVIPSLTGTTNITLLPNQSFYYQFPLLNANDTWTTTLSNLVTNDFTYRIDFIVYRRVGNNVSNYQQWHYEPLQSHTFTTDVEENKTYYLEVRATTNISLDISPTSQEYVLIKDFSGTIEIGTTLDDFDLRVRRRRIEQECDIPLRYRFLEGDLPTGVTFNEAGRLDGIICNLDEMERAKDASPSFNWFFQDHDGSQAAIGLVFRFKVRVYMLTFGEDNPEFTAERWFCIRVYNNWSFDKAKFLEGFQEKEIPTLHCPSINIPEQLKSYEFCCNQVTEQPISSKQNFERITFNLCPCEEPDTTIYHNDIQLTKPIPQLALCEACQDPTKPIEQETILLYTKFSSAEEVLRYYMANVGKTFNPDMAKLANSKLFMELLEWFAQEFNQNYRSLVEMRLNGKVLTLLRFSDETFLDSKYTKLLNTRTKLNQSLEMEGEVWHGMEGSGVYQR